MKTKNRPGDSPATDQKTRPQKNNILYSPQLDMALYIVVTPARRPAPRFSFFQSPFSPPRTRSDEGAECWRPSPHAEKSCRSDVGAEASLWSIYFQSLRRSVPSSLPRSPVALTERRRSGGSERRIVTRRAETRKRLGRRPQGRR